MRARRLLVLALALVLCTVVVALGALGWLVMYYPETRSGSGRGELVEVEVPPHAGLLDVGRKLEASGAVARADVWALYARIRGAESRLRRGETVLVYQHMTPLELLQRLARGYGAAEVRVVIPEGFTRFDIAQRFARFGLCTRAEFLAASEAPALLEELGLTGDSAEGFLFPDTYRFHDAMGAEELVRRLVETAHQRHTELLAGQEARLSALRQAHGWGLRELVTLASIVEKEAAVPAEQPIIAGVFLNRLSDPEFRPKRLQADPTLAYGCLRSPQLPSCVGFDGRRVTRAMLGDVDNPYNTYRHEGLPPGPIANPGLRALRAVLAPAEHDYLYFVARGDGSHRFSATLDDHNRAVDAYQR